MHELYGQSVCVRTVFGAAGAQLIDAMGNAVTWAERFALLDQFLVARASRTSASVCAPEVFWAWQTLVDTHGSRTIGQLTQYTGWSAKRPDRGVSETRWASRQRRLHDCSDLLP